MSEEQELQKFQSQQKEYLLFTSKLLKKNREKEYNQKTQEQLKKTYTLKTGSKLDQKSQELLEGFYSFDNLYYGKGEEQNNLKEFENYFTNKCLDEVSSKIKLENRNALLMTQEFDKCMNESEQYLGRIRHLKDTIYKKANRCFANAQANSQPGEITHNIQKCIHQHFALRQGMLGGELQILKSHMEEEQPNTTEKLEAKELYKIFLENQFLINAGLTSLQKDKEYKEVCEKLLNN